MIVQTFEKMKFYLKTFGADLMNMSTNKKFDLFGDEIIDSFFEVNKFRIMDHISYRTLDETSMTIKEVVEKGNCYVKLFHNSNFNTDIMLILYEHKICIISKDTTIIPTSFVMPLNLTSETLKDYSIQTSGYEKYEQETLYNLLSYCIDQYIKGVTEFMNKDQPK